jgi:hypothetical protein
VCVCGGGVCGVCVCGVCVCVCVCVGGSTAIASIAHFQRCEMFWRRMEKISWTDHVRNEDVLLKSQGAEEFST